jgi:uncharacterized membrane protein
MSDSTAVFRAPQPHIQQIPVDRPWKWLGAGWRDLLATPLLSLACGAVPVVAGWLSAILLIWLDVPYLLLPLGAGFFFVGPFIAVGLYEISRRRETGLPVDFESVAFAWRRNGDQIALMGVFMLVFHLVWMRIAQLLFALFDWRTVPSWDRFADIVWYSSRSLPFLACGIVCGAVLAAVVFTVGAFAIPYLLDRRESNLFEAIATSVAAVRLSPKPMLLWAALIVFFIVLGMVPGLIGLVVTVPLVGHATWHAYRDIVTFKD